MMQGNHLSRQARDNRKDRLKKRRGSAGVIESDCGAVSGIQTHGNAKSQEGAAVAAVKATMDVECDSAYLLRSILVYQPKDLNRDWSPCCSMLRNKNGWVRAKPAGNLNLGVSRNRFCDRLADPDSRSLSRF